MEDAEVLRRAIVESAGEIDPVMAICLSCAVPLWIETMRSWSAGRRETEAHAAGHTIAYGAGAAAVATGGRERNKSSRGNKGAAEVFNAVAKGLAILAYCPGGVTFGGQHWEA